MCVQYIEIYQILGGLNQANSEKSKEQRPNESLCGEHKSTLLMLEAAPFNIRR